MKPNSFKCLLICIGFSYSCNLTAQPSTEDFKAAFVKELQQLLPEGYEKRTIKIVEVIPGAVNSGTYSYKVTAYIHDYDEGYPPNQYYGQTCLGKMDGYRFTMHKDDFGEWLVQGRFTVPDANCKTNTAEGVRSIPLETVPGTIYTKGSNAGKGTEKTQPAKEVTASTLYIGEYASYGTGGRMMAGMGFTLLVNGKYHDLDKGRAGVYVYNKQKGTITFNGGFLDGQIGKNVNANGFDLSATVHCEPWR